jgi:hypothetical protein
MVGDSNPGDYEVWENRQSSRSPPNEPDGVASLHARAHRMFEDERMRLRDTLSFERQHPPTREIDGPLMPPVPESRDYSAFDERRREIQRLHDVRRDLRRIARRRPAPTPPYTETDLAFMARVGTDSPRPSSLTPALSPARRLDPTDTENSRGLGTRVSDDSVDFTSRESPFTNVSNFSVKFQCAVTKFSTIKALLFISTSEHVADYDISEQQIQSYQIEFKLSIGHRTTWRDLAD